MRKGESRKAIDGLSRIVERNRRAAVRARLAALRAQIKEARAEKRIGERDIGRSAKAELKRIRQRTKDLRTSLREASKAAAELAKFVLPGASGIVSGRKAAALAVLAQSHGERAKQLGDEAERVNQTERVQRGGSMSSKRQSGMNRTERAEQSDDDVRANLPRELLAVWEARKSKTKATANASRTEVFTEWVSDHPADAARIAEAADSDISELIAEERELTKEYERQRRQ